MEFVIPSFLPKMQDLRDHAKRSDLAVFVVTNFMERIDDAILRAGRIDYHFLVLPYSRLAREQIIETFFLDKKLPSTDVRCVGLKNALEFYPCNLGYRDIETLVEFIFQPGMPPTGPTREDIYERARRLGTQPDTYPKGRDVEGRIQALLEFAHFSARLTDSLIKEENCRGERELRDFIRRCASKVRDLRFEGRDHYEHWVRLMDIWD